MPFVVIDLLDLIALFDEASLLEEAAQSFVLVSADIWIQKQRRKKNEEIFHPIVISLGSLCVLPPLRPFLLLRLPLSPQEAVRRQQQPQSRSKHQLVLQDPLLSVFFPCRFGSH